MERRLVSRAISHTTRNTKKRILAMPIAAPASPPKPSMAATRASTKKTSDQCSKGHSLCRLCTHQGVSKRRARVENRTGRVGTIAAAAAYSMLEESMKSVYLLLAVFVLGLGGCVIDAHHSGPVEYSSESVEADDSDLVRVNLNMGAGDLRVTEGTQKLMRGAFSYNVPSWKPEVRYRRSGKQGMLAVEQPGPQRGNLGNR